MACAVYIVTKDILGKCGTEIIGSSFMYIIQVSISYIMSMFIKQYKGKLSKYDKI